MISGWRSLEKSVLHVAFAGAWCFQLTPTALWLADKQGHFYCLCESPAHTYFYALAAQQTADGTLEWVVAAQTETGMGHRERLLSYRLEQEALSAWLSEPL